LARGRFAALQVPHHRGPLRVVTPALVRRAHAAGVHVHVWTIDDEQQMAFSRHFGPLEMMLPHRANDKRPDHIARLSNIDAEGNITADIDPEAHTWCTTDYEPGDVILFHSLTVHWAPDNNGDRLRISADYRYAAAVASA
jgi:hypothetical protein